MADGDIETHVRFHSSALEPGDLILRVMSGREALGSIYEFDLELQTLAEEALDDEQLDAVLGSSAYVAFGADEQHRIHGWIRELEMLPLASSRSTVRYRALMVPRLWDATQVFGSWIYQKLPVGDIIRDVMKDLGLKEGEDFEVRLANKHPVWEYTVQYEETDLNFLSRLCEHEGLTIWFEQGDDKEKAIFSDSNQPYQPIEGQEILPYEPRGNVIDATEAVVALSHKRRVLPTSVVLKDYNYRTPETPLLGEAPADDHGVGKHTLYSEHFKDAAEGKRLAKIRSQELTCRKDLYSGRSRVRGLRAGHRFTLEGHPVPALDQEYLVLEVSHHVAQGEGDEAEGSVGYSNSFTAIPASVVFRPARVAPKPKIIGLMHAKIDGIANGAAAPIDEHGRYKVRMPFDNAVGALNGTSSRWIRMAQPSSGDGYGMHFPLHLGTEVVIAHIDGDPDRPIILGSVPNPNTTTPVSRDNATQAAVRTRAGIRIEFEDDQ